MSLWFAWSLDKYPCLNKALIAIRFAATAVSGTFSQYAFTRPFRVLYMLRYTAVIEQEKRA